LAWRDQCWCFDLCCQFCALLGLTAL